MNRRVDDASHLRPLLALVKSKSGRSDDASSQPPSAIEVEADTPRSCVSCGYELSGQETQNCPECGLTLARSYCDPTAWGRSFQVDPEAIVTLKDRWRAYIDTCMAVIRFDRRTSIRTALLPATPTSRKFAIVTSLACIPFFAVVAVMAGVGFVDQQSLHPAVFLIVVGWLSALAGGVLMLLSIPILEFLLRSYWKKSKHPFVPSAVHYSYPSLFSALVTAIVILSLLRLFEISLGTANAILGLAILIWPIWLWNGVSQSERKHHFFPRLALACVSALIATGIITKLSTLKTAPTPILSSRQPSKNIVRAMLSDGADVLETMVNSVKQPRRHRPRAMC